jgi:hypothetical protein
VTTLKRILEAERDNALRQDYQSSQDMQAIHVMENARNQQDENVAKSMGQKF